MFLVFNLRAIDFQSNFSVNANNILGAMVAAKVLFLMGSRSGAPTINMIKLAYVLFNSTAKRPNMAGNKVCDRQNFPLSNANFRLSREFF